MDRHLFNQTHWTIGRGSGTSKKKQTLFAVKADESPLSPDFILREYPQLSPYNDQSLNFYGDDLSTGLKLVEEELLLFVEATSGLVSVGHVSFLY